MLILQRKISETILVGDDVKITVLDVQGCQVRLGIKAPQDIPVHRAELNYRILHEKSLEEAVDLNDETVSQRHDSHHKPRSQPTITYKTARRYPR